MTNSAEICRANGWGIGTRLVGDEGFGPTVIEITAIGRFHILAVGISHDGKNYQHLHEGCWSLECREWKVAPCQ